MITNHDREEAERVADEQREMAVRPAPVKLTEGEKLIRLGQMAESVRIVAEEIRRELPGLCEGRPSQNLKFAAFELREASQQLTDYLLQVEMGLALL